MGLKLKNISIKNVKKSVYRMSGLGKLTKVPKLDINPINDKYMGMNPGGTLSPEDVAMAERTRLAGTRSAARTAELGRQSAYRQAVTRGLSGASAAALAQEVDQQEARSREGAGMAAANQTYDMYAGNRGFNRDKMMTAWGNEVGQARTNLASEQAQQAMLWNSINEAISGISGAFKSGASAAAAPATGGASMAAGGRSAGGRGGASYQPGVVGRTYQSPPAPFGNY